MGGSKAKVFTDVFYALYFTFFTVAIGLGGNPIKLKLVSSEYQATIAMGILSILFAAFYKFIDAFSSLSKICKNLSTGIIGLIVVPILSFVCAVIYFSLYCDVSSITDYFGYTYYDSWFSLALIGTFFSLCFVISSIMYYRKAGIKGLIN